MREETGEFWHTITGRFGHDSLSGNVCDSRFWIGDERGRIVEMSTRETKDTMCISNKWLLTITVRRSDSSSSTGVNGGVEGDAYFMIDIFVSTEVGFSGSTMEDLGCQHGWMWLEFVRVRFFCWRRVYLGWHQIWFQYFTSELVHSTRRYLSLASL